MIDIKNYPGLSILYSAVALGGDGGFYLKNMTTKIKDTPPAIAYAIKQLLIWSLNYSSVSSSVTHIAGSTNPIPAPIAYAATAIVIAITLSFYPNQTAASLVGAFDKKGYPIAAKTYPRIQIQNP